MKNINLQALAILVLVAALVVVCTAYVVKSAGTPVVQNSHQDKAVSTEGGQVEKIEWKLVTSWPKGFPGLGTAPEMFALTSISSSSEGIGAGDTVTFVILGGPVRGVLRSQIAPRV